MTSDEDLSPAPNGTTNEPRTMTVDELAALLRVDRKSAYAAIQRDEIPGVIRVGRAIRISREAVVHWLAAGQGRVSRSRRIP
jgi:excisionase family DNA binding protein